MKVNSLLIPLSHHHQLSKQTIAYTRFLLVVVVTFTLLPTKTKLNNINADLCGLPQITEGKGTPKSGVGKVRPVEKILKLN
jgi:hypothetical protein